MKAAIYARKSSDNEAGVQRQVDLARDFAVSKGWTVAPEHVYSNNDFSGASFNRPGLNALLAALQQRPLRCPGDDGVLALLVSTPVQKLVASVQNFGAEDFRWQIKLKTTQALKKKFEQGHHVGGRAYGYRPLRMQDHSEWRVEPMEAEVIVRIFDLVAQGYGLRNIARLLNQEGVRGPRGRGWATTSLKYLVTNRLYLGDVRRGDVTQTRAELRVVSEEQWQAAHARLARTRAKWAGFRKAHGQLEGRPEAGLVSQHLLSGFLQCALCSAALTVITRTSRKGSVRRYCGCGSFYKQGRPCGNKGLIPYDGLQKRSLREYVQ